MIDFLQRKEAACCIDVPKAIGSGIAGYRLPKWGSHLGHEVGSNHVEIQCLPLIPSNFVKLAQCLVWVSQVWRQLDNLQQQCDGLLISAHHKPSKLWVVLNGKHSSLMSTYNDWRSYI